MIFLFQGQESNGMKWGGIKDPPCSANTEPQTTRNPRKDYLMRMFILLPLLCLLCFQYNLPFSWGIRLQENTDYISTFGSPLKHIAKLFFAKTFSKFNFAFSQTSQLKSGSTEFSAASTWTLIFHMHAWQRILDPKCDFIHLENFSMLLGNCPIYLKQPLIISSQKGWIQFWTTAPT